MTKVFLIAQKFNHKAQYTDGFITCFISACHFGLWLHAVFDLGLCIYSRKNAIMRLPCILNYTFSTTHSSMVHTSAAHLGEGDESLSIGHWCCRHSSITSLCCVVGHTLDYISGASIILCYWVGFIALCHSCFISLISSWTDHDIVDHSQYLVIIQ